MEQFPRISHDINIMGGKACIKGTRVTVGNGVSTDELLGDYPYLAQEDVSQALKYAAWIVNAQESAIQSV